MSLDHPRGRFGVLSPVSRRLPAQPTPFVGRAAELAAVKTLLLHPDVRLLTLTGPPGIGKTRLALAAATLVAAAFDAGVSFVDLSPLSDAALVPMAIGQVLGIEDVESQSVADLLVQVLGGQHRLLILDNVEHVLSAGALVGDLLAACPRLTVLATSRVPLHLRWEHRFPVPPLRLPRLDQLPDPQALLTEDAVALFVERVRAVNPGFALHQQNSRTVADICVRLDGLPLAIELAAAQGRFLPPPALLDRLTDCQAVLTSELQDRPERHRTLRAAIDWSYHFLDPPAQAVFRRLAVFRGGCTLDAAVAVAGDDALTPAARIACEPVGLVSATPFLPPSAWPRAEPIARLVDQSLLQIDERPDGQPRFRLLETIRDYARECLTASGELTRTQCRHASYYLDLAERAAPRLRGPQQSAWFEHLECEHDNFRTALSWSIDGGDPTLGLRMVAALWLFWSVRGYVTEGRGWLAAVLAAQSAATLSEVRAEALRGAGELAILQQDYSTARSSLTESLAISRARDDRRGVVASLNVLASAAYEEADYVTAHALCEESIALARADGDRPGIASAQWIRGLIAYEQGDDRGARSSLDECLVICRQLGDLRGTAAALNALGDVACERGEYPRARGYFEDALAIWQGVTGSRGGLANILKNLGTVAAAEGTLAAARALFEESLAIWREVGDRRGIAFCLDRLGVIAREQNDLDGACALCEEGRLLRQQTRNQRGLAKSLRSLGLIALEQERLGEARTWLVQGLQIEWAAGRQGDLLPFLDALAVLAMLDGQVERALHLAGAAAAWRKMLGRPARTVDQAWLERRLAPSRQALSVEEVAARWAEGQALSLGSAVALALSAAEPSQAQGPEPLERAAGALAGRLSRREREVAGLIAQGLTNRQIATALTITEGTVASHVVHILTKLGLRSRTQIAAWVLDPRRRSSSDN